MGLKNYTGSKWLGDPIRFPHSSNMARSRVQHGVALSPPKRKSWGEGKAAQMKSRRNDLATKLAGIIHERVDADRISATGELFPRATFKKTSQKQLFDFCFQFEGRIFTTPLCKLVIRKLVNLLGRDTIPKDPKVSYAKYVSKQATRFQKLVRQAKRYKAQGMKTIFVLTI